MTLDNAVVFVTGANRGIGLAFAQAALARGARKVYAASRDPAKVTLAGVEPIRLDVTDDAAVAAAAARCGDVTVLVNNAGIAKFGGALGDDPVASLQAQFDVNVLGILRMARAFAPVLARNGGGAMLNVLSVASWINRGTLGLYGTTKSAAWGLTNSLRHELRPQGTQVLALHVGFVDTDLTRDIDAPKSSAAVVVGRALDALEAGQEEVLADEISQQVKRGLSADAPVYLAAA
ncbi:MULTISPECIES: SDR family oxidoreductase [Ramlibacter]|uniref:SDR family oxidoreductase n=1 Tax=Ramlibacter pinisoli TaxID=2682844 RepID=A0A6N8ISG9_9BURK|nr:MULTISPECIES: SDR family oxidoreductase [Ramlibacter]MBA2964886.1 SDR family oxidoreductase [Ramlibacter sp. CGMCC 1.13660]MVQ29851.1 SDR family oxidoreductase [Ramlibacter pinisoli]